MTGFGVYEELCRRGRLGELGDPGVDGEGEGSRE